MNAVDRRSFILRAALKRRLDGRPLDAAAVDEIATALGKPIEQVAAVVAFVERIVTPPPGCQSLIGCISTSCKTNGADSLLALLASFLEASGSPLKMRFVFCLEQCNFGPSIALDRWIYRGTCDDVIEDARGWRRETQQSVCGS